MEPQVPQTPLASSVSQVPPAPLNGPGIQPQWVVPDLPPAPPDQPGLSYFDGNSFQLLGWRLLGFLLGLITLGLAAPWCQVMIYRWEAKHTVVGGKRLRFNGTGLQLLGKWLLWGLLCLVTCGIFAFFIPVGVKKWHTSHLYPQEACPEPEGTHIAVKILLILLAAILVVGLVGGVLLYVLGSEVSLPTWGEGKESTVHHETIPLRPVRTEPEKITIQPQQTQPQRFYITANGGLRLREEPSLDSLQLAIMPKGELITVEQWQDEWAKVTYEGKTGWCNGRYLSLEEPEQTEPQQTQPQATEPQQTQPEKPPVDGYTWDQVNRAMEEANRVFIQGKGTPPVGGIGSDTLTESQVIDLYKRAMDAVYTDWWVPGHFSYNGDPVPIVDMPGIFLVPVWDEKVQNLEQWADRFYSVLSDDAAYDAIRSTVCMLDGTMYAIGAGMGDEGLYVEYTYTVKQDGDGYALTMDVVSIRGYGQPDQEVMEWSVTYRCFKEDWVWVFNGAYSPYDQPLMK